MKTRMILILPALFCALCLTAPGCSRARVPAEFDEIDAPPAIYPDFAGTVFPINIAPANFRIEEEGDDFVTRFSGGGMELTVPGSDVIVTPKDWRRLLDACADGEFSVDVWAKRSGKWTKFASFTNGVSSDPIDGYVAYRLIEPGYDYGHRILLAQRSLENYDEHVFFNNRCSVDSPCLNCHSFQDRKTQRFLFHYRRVDDPAHGGTIVVNGDDAYKAGCKVEDLDVSCSYPAWRPTGSLVAFSANMTRQSFHSLSSQKIEVGDAFSDLVLFDADKNELKRVTETEDVLETFPFWSPDGSELYYCCASYKAENTRKEAAKLIEEMTRHATDLRYDIVKRSFDEKTRTFGEPETVVDAASQGRTALFPRISPDGNFLAYARAESGTFPIWRPEADLYLIDLRTGEERRWDEVNSDDAESYHVWSSSGRWLLFSSRRDDGLYTRLYIAHVDSEGRASKPFVLPQRDPRHNRRRFKSYNVPELTVEPIRVSEHVLCDAAFSPTKDTKNMK